MAECGPNTISLDVAAGLLKVTPRRVQQLVKEGWIKKSGRGGYSLVAVVHGYIDFLQDEERRSSKGAAASAVQEARAREIQLRTDREFGQLISMTDAEAVFGDVIGGLRSELAGVPAACTRDLAQRTVIEGHLSDAIGRARSRFEEARAALLSGRGEPVGDEA